MEIEAKFAVPDADTFQRLRTVKRLAGFAIAAGKTREVHDTYLDTADRAILAAGYSCRRRQQDGSILITLKGLGGAEGAIHRREELEVLLPADRPPSKWPDGPVHDWVHQVIGRSRLASLFALKQTRTVRPLRAGRRLVAEISLDDVHLSVKGGEHAYFEAEVELLPDGTEGDLAAIVTCLQEEWGLQPELRSKFERGLALVEETRQGGRLLTPQERAVCLQVAKQHDEFHAQRAQALLAMDEGTLQKSVGQQVGRAPRTVRRWLAAFRQRRLGIFPDHIMPRIAPPLPSPAEAPAVSRKPPPPQERPKPPEKPGLEASDTMAEAARKTLYFHFLRMVYHEPGTRLGQDIEKLHDMRVATRRMRAAFRVFGDYLDMGQMKKFLKDLQRTGRTLGAVRDLDVFWEKTQHYLDTLPPERQDELEPLRAVWEAERKRSREKMIAYLDGARYLQFKEQFEGFLQTPGAGALPPFSDTGEPVPNRLRHVVPVLVYQRLVAARAYDEWVTGPEVPLERLHQLRIAAKGLRYTLEFFEEVLGPEAKTAIKEIKGLQDHLGDLQDAVVASNLLRDFLTWGTWGHAQTKESVPPPTEPVVAPGVAAYLAARQIELQRLVETFPQAWARIQSPDFGQLVAAALSTL